MPDRSTPGRPNGLRISFGLRITSSAKGTAMHARSKGIAIGVCLLLPCLASQGVSAQQWDFESPLGLADWENDSSPPTADTFELTTFDSRSVLTVTAEANTNDRVKVRTVDTFRTGTYEWHVYIPTMQEQGATNAIAAFLYSEQSGDDTSAREIDFEIGEGTSADRQQYNVPAGHLLCWMTVQRDDSSGTALDQIAFQPENPADHVARGYWYTYTIELKKDSWGRYVVSWYIQKEGGPVMKGRRDAICNYGPGDTDFWIYCSSENFDTNWIGDYNPPQSDQVGHFDWVRFTDGVTNLITDVESDTTAGAAPPGTAAREWTRFGPAYDSILIGQPPAPDPVLLTDLSEPDFTEWSEANPRPGEPGYDPDLHGGFPDTAIDHEWSRFGAAFNGIYLLTTSVADAPTVYYKARRTGGSAMTMGLVFQETDGDVWMAKVPHTLTASWVEYSLALTSANLELADSSGGGDLDHHVALLGFQVVKNSDSGTPSFDIDDLYWASAQQPANKILITDISADTVGTYPPGSDRAWTRFGNAFNTLDIVSGALHAVTDFINGSTYNLRYNVVGTELDMGSPPPDRYLKVLVDWSVGSSLGIRYNIPDAPLDTSSGPAMSYRISYVKEPGATGDPQVKFVVEEADGDVWEGRVAITPTSTEQTYTQEIDFRKMQKVDGSGDGVLDASAIQRIGFSLLADGATGQGAFHINDIYWRATVPVTNNTVVAKADWGQGAWFGVQYNLPDAPWDISTGPVVSYRMKYNNVGEPRVKFQICDQDGEVWETPAHSLTDEYVTYRHDLEQTTLTRADGNANNQPDFDAVAHIGFVFLANGASSGTPTFQIDEIYWNEAPNPSLPLITSMEDPDRVYIPAGQTVPGLPPDPTSGTFPDGVPDGSWTRFGAPFESLRIIRDPDAGTDGDQYLELTADWSTTEGDKVGVRYLLFNHPLDLSGAHSIVYDMRADVYDTNTTHRIALVEGDGNIWLGPARPVYADWTTEGVILDTCELTLEPGSGTGTALDLSNIVMVGVNFVNAVSTGRQVFRFDHVRVGALPEPGEPTMRCVRIVFGGANGYVSGNVTGLPPGEYYVKTYVETDQWYYQGTGPVDEFGDFQATGFWGTWGNLWIIVHDASDDSVVFAWDPIF